MKKQHLILFLVVILAINPLLGKKITEMDLLNSSSVNASDRLIIVDVSESVSKAIVAAELREYAQTGFTASSRAAVIGSTGQIEAGDVTITELARLDGLTSSIVTESGTQGVRNKGITECTIDDTAIGSTTPSTGGFTTLTATSADINGGTLDNTAIGSTTPSTGGFTTLTATSADINGGTIDGATIGNSSRSTGKFTSINANDSMYSPVITTDESVIGSLQTGKLHTVIYSNYAVADGTASTLDIDLSAIPTGARIIGCQIRVDEALGTTWGADYANDAGNQKICETGNSGSAHTKIKAFFDYSTDSGILGGLGGAFKVVISGAGTISNDGRVSVFVWYEYFENVENYSGSGS